MCKKCGETRRSTGQQHSGDAAREAGWSVPSDNRLDRAVCPECLRGDVPDRVWVEQANRDLEYRRRRVARERADRRIAEAVFAQGRRELTPVQEAAIGLSKDNGGYLISAGPK